MLADGRRWSGDHPREAFGRGSGVRRAKRVLSVTLIPIKPRQDIQQEARHWQVSTLKMLNSDYF